MGAVEWEKVLVADHDPLLRGVYADWLDDNGLEHGEGWRALMWLNRRPAMAKDRARDGSVLGFKWFLSGMTTHRFIEHFGARFVRSSGRTGGGYGANHPHLMPDLWFRKIRPRVFGNVYNANRFELEQLAAIAWGKLLPVEKDGILSVLKEVRM
jgi:hypothetical protein